MGIGHHLYHNSRWLRGSSDRSRLLHTSFITMLFNLGSVLLIAITGSYLPRLQLVRGAWALAASLALLHLGLDFLEQQQQQQQPPKAV